MDDRVFLTREQIMGVLPRPAVLVWQELFVRCSGVPGGSCLVSDLQRMLRLSERTVRSSLAMLAGFGLIEIKTWSGHGEIQPDGFHFRLAMAVRPLDVCLLGLMPRTEAELVARRDAASGKDPEA